jgi:catechol 2,3-dioxygenase-like lactoylglutathione lyase family enzyme
MRLGNFSVIVPVLACLFVAGCASTRSANPSTPPSGDPPLQLGNFSVSLAVKDIAASRAFYEKLGFKMVSGDQSRNWVVLQNDNARIGLFQGMFPRNTLTFNPGWDGNKNTLPEFEDVRDLQKTLKARGLTPDPAADESTNGPAFLMLTDPDGNPILIDQHVPSPKK